MTVILEVKVRLIIDTDIYISEVMEVINYSFNSGEGFDVLDTEILDYDITDSK